MKCKNCGSEIRKNLNFCEACGSKVEPINFEDNQERLDRTSTFTIPKKKSLIGPIILIAIVISVILVFFIIGKKKTNTGFSPVGLWKSDNGMLELDFKKRGVLLMGLCGDFREGMHWKSEENDSYRISGEIPTWNDEDYYKASEEFGWQGYQIEYLGDSIYYDEEDEVLCMEVNEDVLLFEKVR